MMQKIQIRWNHELKNHLISFWHLHINIMQIKKYRSLLATLQTQKSLKNDQYPLTIADANTVLSGHRLDNIGDKKGQGKTSKEK
jgi:hypothetical protein